ncbi:uncharacterized protein [Typha latifolia]|uniref:uncharacterized protein isoform X1 n=2 Tax=Typha latifolia TaxID=4733 RepID=UPI003C2F2AB3
MKCPSVACLWPGAAPPHHVTASAVIPHHPAALYTGGSDGSIIWWDLSSSEIRPVAILCGHAAAISGLAVVGGASASSIVSVCTAGVLCAWSSGAGRCRRRRKLPSWVGIPTHLSSLPSSLRHVCLVCSSAAADGDDFGKRSPRCAVVIIDSYSLNVVKTAFHGILSIGPPKALVVVAASEEAERKTKDAILVDGHGRIQVMDVSESDQDGQDGIFSNSSSSFPPIGENSGEGVRAVAVSADGKLLVLVSESRCLFKRVSDGITVGEISLVGSSLCEAESMSKDRLIGGFFLQGSELGTGNSDDSTVRIVAFWSTNGAGIVYRISASCTIFEFEPLCEIPAMTSMPEGKADIRFCQLNSDLVRVDSHCFAIGESLLWKPYVSRWVVPKLESNVFDSLGSPPLSTLLAEGGLPGEEYRTWPSCCVNEAKEVNKKCPVDFDELHVEPENSYLAMSKRIVSSSMVLSEDFYAPYAVVCGFYSGEIEVIQFMNVFPEAKSRSEGTYPHIFERFFPGHTGAILCLAAHRMHARAEEQRFSRALISGSLDCTIRIWDLDTGSLLSVMHHHVAPVRQIILPPPWTHCPWNDCFLSVGDDDCVALVSLHTMRVERMFPGHPSYPLMVAWDSKKGYIACLCRSPHSSDDTVSVLYLWDVKTGARERIIRGTASLSMFDHFCRGISKNAITGSILGGTTSASSLLLPLISDKSFSQFHSTESKKEINMSSAAGNSHRGKDNLQLSASLAQSSKGKVPEIGVQEVQNDMLGNNAAKDASSERIHQKKKLPVKCSCPFPGIASLRFDLSALMFPPAMLNCDKQVKAHVSDHGSKGATFQDGTLNDSSDVQPIDSPSKTSLEGRLLRFSLCFLHLWDVDHELDKLLVDEMDICKPEGFCIAPGVPGDRGSITLMFPGMQATLELWKSSSEFCAMRSLTIVSLAQHMISLSHSCSTASSALAAFYTRKFAEKVPDIKPPLLQLLVSFWQHPCEHVRMAARSLFHCAAPRAVPRPLCGQKIKSSGSSSTPSYHVENFFSNMHNASLTSKSEMKNGSIDRDECAPSGISSWLESFEIQEWVSWIRGTSQDAVASNIIVAAALVVWYPSIVDDMVASLVVNQLIKLVMSMNDRYSSTAAELLAEGMESSWKACLGTEVPRLIGDVLFQIECLSSTPTGNGIHNQAVAVTIREALIGILLPNLAVADIMGYFGIVERQIWATSSDSPVHLISLKTLIRVVRGSPKHLAPYLDKAVSYVLQTMDPSNLVMRKACLSSSIIALREIARAFPMVSINKSFTRLAVGDAIGDIQSSTIRVYDIESVTKIRILDASGPPGLPSLLEGASSTKITIIISALSFSPDGEGLVAFSENGFMIRWWSLGTAWWERLSRSLVPVQCTKLILVPPWEGFSPKSSRLSIMANVLSHDKSANSEDKKRELEDADNLKMLHNLDLSYCLQWIGGRTIKLTRHGQELGIFQL